ncbi:ferrous iron transport protein B [Atopomonas hussainii]|uniref:Ferrous iron transport protein B n=1 Tax=Atopomonas hussainii TaxID=1429083 RepID=A0A1H7SCZ1_9GAMM|nr:ferrous iron transporter B [Atopomonas hussainii]SEL69397.1 ferrous iron transport protein B [Atopomonas hussainii]
MLAALFPLHRDVDAWLLHPIWGRALFAVLLYGLFFLAYTLTEWPMELIDGALASLAQWLNSQLPASEWTRLLVEGIVPGVAAVLVFLPTVASVFVGLAVLEHSGYLQRAAQLFAPLMARFGLPGQALLSLALGFGCNVPSVLSAQSLPRGAQRTALLLSAPLMSCSARLPVYVLLAAACFKDNAVLVILAVHAWGVALALGLSWFISRKQAPTLIAVQPSLSPMKVPSVGQVFGDAYRHSSDFLRKIGQVILLGAMLIWFLQSYPANQQGELQGPSYLEQAGQVLSPVTAPLNFTWQDNVALLSGLVAKEVIVSTMVMTRNLPSVDGDDDAQTLGWAGALSQQMSPSQALAFMLFTLLYFPCLATLGTLRRLGGWRLPLMSMGFGLTTAWLSAYAVTLIGAWL